MRFQMLLLLYLLRRRTVGLVIHQGHLAIDNDRPLLRQINHRIHPLAIRRFLRPILPPLL